MTFRGVLLICFNFYDDCIYFLCYQHKYFRLNDPRIQTQIKYNIAAYFIMRIISSFNSYAKVMKTGTFCVICSPTQPDSCKSEFLKLFKEEHFFWKINSKRQLRGVAPKNELRIEKRK